MTVDTDTNHRVISLPQTEDEDSGTTAKSMDTLIDQVRVLMTDAARFEVRAQHLHRMNTDQLLTPWATAVQPYPPFIQSNQKLLTRIREIKLDAVRKIQEITATEFDRQSAKLDKEAETLIVTLETMMEGKHTPTFEERLTHTANTVGKIKATLQSKLEDCRAFLAKRQPTHKDWDDYFRYSIAYRRSQDAFEVTPVDKAPEKLNLP